MLRAILIYLSKAAWARRLVTRWPFARRAAARFIAGDTLDECIVTIQSINQRGLLTTVDHLGENVTNPEEARRAADDYLVIMDRICSSGVHSNASLKLSQLGMALDYDLCLDNMRRILHKAAECGMMVRIDIEDASTVDRTIKLYRALRASGMTNVGLALQSYLYRTEKDMLELLPEQTPIRLCKGAYKEAATVAYPRKQDVDENYDRLARLMIDASLKHGARLEPPDGKIPPLVALATHDPKRIEAAKAYAAQVNFPKQALEFQMLYGIRGDLQTQLAAEGYPVRLYVPYGTSWYPYYVRRLAERPANVWFFVSNFFRG